MLESLLEWGTKTAPYTEFLFRSLLYGGTAILLGGAIFESGKRYVKTGRSNQFKSKIAALPFFIGTVIAGAVIQEIDPYVNQIVFAVEPISRIGLILVMSMILFNYSVPEYRYDDSKSLGVYFVGVALIIVPYL